MKEKRKTISVGGKQIIDGRGENPGYEGAGILFSPVDVLVVGKTIVGKIGYTDQRDSESYQETLEQSVAKADIRDGRKKLSVKTISIEKATELGLAHKPFVVNIN